MKMLLLLAWLGLCALVYFWPRTNCAYDEFTARRARGEKFAGSCGCRKCQRRRGRQLRL